MRRWDRTFRWALAVSILFHVAVFLVFREEQIIPTTVMGAAGERAGDSRAAAGGGLQMIAFSMEGAFARATVAVQPESEPVPVPVPDPVPEVEEPEVEPEVEPRQPIEASQGQGQGQNQGQTAAAGSGVGEGVGPGVEGGTGRGDGGTGTEGLNTVRLPEPRGMILPPSDRPGRVRGMTVTVYVFVASNGAVVSDSTRIAPSTGDSRFDRRLRDDAAQWKFRPGMSEGTPVAAWFPYTITF